LLLLIKIVYNLTSTNEIYKVIIVVKLVVVVVVEVVVVYIYSYINWLRYGHKPNIKIHKIQSFSHFFLETELLIQKYLPANQLYWIHYLVIKNTKVVFFLRVKGSDSDEQKGGKAKWKWMGWPGCWMIPNEWALARALLTKLKFNFEHSAACTKTDKVNKLRLPTHESPSQYFLFLPWFFLWRKQWQIFGQNIQKKRRK